MLTAENQGDAIELTSQQKYNRLRPKATVEVKLVSHTGAEEKWLEAKIKDSNKEGAYCKITGGTLTRFWHWREIRPCAQTELPRATATLGEVAQAHLRPVELPRRDPLPAPPALRAALVPTPAPTPPVTLVRLTRPEPQQQQQSPPSEIPQTAGEMIRRGRMLAGLTQDALAGKLAKLTGDAGLTNKRLSRLETGGLLPSETEQIAIVEALGIDLAQLIAACERDTADREREKKRKSSRESAQRKREERAAMEGRPIAHRSSAYRPREAAAAPPARKAVARGPETGTLEDLIDALIAIVPMPLDSGERKNWFRCARELFALSGGR